MADLESKSSQVLKMSALFCEDISYFYSKLRDYCCKMIWYLLVLWLREDVFYKGLCLSDDFISSADGT